ncbi:peptide deformylase [Paenisporosarcina sp. FSL H8-0542]|uniref:peptide deformylase n=1 Tax=unclassified Paenisporosarcina TaxID=2642018 RepID=UPI00034EAB64|nr:peptide deformylase [Paenisporosarcina sp. HGH0030]EPD52845.1 peptide deformylase [Paenisporosarcina sp. HGH0030]
MTIRKIVLHPNEILTTPTKEVTEFDQKLATLLDDMYETMLESDGIGIAAPQVGELLRVAIVDLGEGEDIIEMINPLVVDTEGEAIEVEGCLSFPELYGEVERPYFVQIKAQERDGTWYELEAEDYEARAILHEIDHLDGVLFDSKIIRVVDPSELETEEEELI